MLINKFRIHEQIHKHTLSWKMSDISILKVNNIGEVEESLAINNILSYFWKKCLHFWTSQGGKGGGGRKRTRKFFLTPMFGRLDTIRKHYFLTPRTISFINPKCFPLISASVFQMTKDLKIRKTNNCGQSLHYWHSKVTIDCPPCNQKKKKTSPHLHNSKQISNSSRLD